MACAHCPFCSDNSTQHGYGVNTGTAVATPEGVRGVLWSPCTKPMIGREGRAQALCQGSPGTALLRSTTQCNWSHPMLHRSTAGRPASVQSSLGSALPLKGHELPSHSHRKGTVAIPGRAAELGEDGQGRHSPLPSRLMPSLDRPCRSPSPRLSGSCRRHSSCRL